MRWILLLASTLLLAGCSRELNALRHQVETFLRGHPELLYIAGGVVVVALIAKALRLALVLGLLALLLLGFYFLARF